MDQWCVEYDEKCRSFRGIGAGPKVPTTIVPRVWTICTTSPTQPPVATLAVSIHAGMVRWHQLLSRAAHLLRDGASVSEVLLDSTRLRGSKVVQKVPLLDVEKLDVETRKILHKRLRHLRRIRDEDKAEEIVVEVYQRRQQKKTIRGRSSDNTLPRETLNRGDPGV